MNVQAVRSEQDAKPTRRRAWPWRLLAVALLLAGVAAGATLGGYVGQLSAVADNDESAFLPVDAEATHVSRMADRFVDTDTVPTVLVYTSDSALTPDQLSTIESDMRRVGRLSAVDGTPQGPRVSDDRHAAAVLLRLRPHGATGVLDGVRAVRNATSGHHSLTAHVTGAGGFQADQTVIFQRIDGLLLLVALAVVFVILVLVYRSPLLPVIVLVTAGVALSVAGGVVYLLARDGHLTLNGQAQGILMVLVVGASTDYALLLVSRYREELRRHVRAVEAMAAALRGVLAPILASGATVAIALLCLLLSDLKSTRSVGPVGAIGIAASVLTALVFLPAVLLLASRVAYWPLRPRYGSTAGRRSVGAGVAALVTRHARPVWLVLVLVLVGAGLFVGQFRASGTTAAEELLQDPDAVAGQQATMRHFDTLADQPAQVVTRADRLTAVVAAARSVRGTGQVRPVTASAHSRAPKTVDGRAMVLVTLTDPADSPEAIDTIDRLRTAVHRVTGADAEVGGATAVTADAQRISVRDRNVIIPVVLAVILLVLLLLLRAVVAPLLMIATVVLSYVATLGVAALVFNDLLDFPNSGPAVPLFAFVFLVALGVDYNVFLMSRIREEAMGRGTVPGIAGGLAATGGVITSAGVVLAATFGALTVIPMLFLVQMAFLVGFGVLLDSLLVRSLLLPALSADIGRAIWWPARRPAH